MGSCGVKNPQLFLYGANRLTLKNKDYYKNNPMLRSTFDFAN